MCTCVCMHAVLCIVILRFLWSNGKQTLHMSLLVRWNISVKILAASNIQFVYRVAIMNCIWLKSLDCGYTWALLDTTRFFQLHQHSLLRSHCCWTELIYRAATVTFNHTHNARAINTRCRQMKTKRKRRRILSSAQSAYMTKWKLKHTPPVI